MLLTLGWVIFEASAFSLLSFKDVFEQRVYSAGRPQYGLAEFNLTEVPNAKQTTKSKGALRAVSGSKAASFVLQSEAKNYLLLQGQNVNTSIAEVGESETSDFSITDNMSSSTEPKTSSTHQKEDIDTDTTNSRPDRFETWRHNGSHKTGRDPRLAPLACRISNACQMEDGSLLFPSSISAHQRYFGLCGFKHYSFKNVVDMGSIDFITGYEDRELYSTEPVRTGRRASVLQFSKIIFQQHVMQHLNSSRSFSYKCYEGELKCNTSMILNSTTSRGMLLTSKHDAQISSWTQSMLDLFDNGNQNMIARSASSLFPAPVDRKNDTVERPRAICFRSISENGEAGHRIPLGSFETYHPFYKQNNMSREPAVRNSSSSKTPFNVLLVQHGLERILTQVNEIEKQLKKTMERIKGRVAVEVVRLDVVQTPFSDLRAQFQRADIVIVPHGEDIANMLFLRKKTTIIEVYPFSLEAGPYNEMATQLEVRHSGISAEPDTKTFIACMSEKYPEDENFKELKGKWTKSAVKFKDGHIGNSLHLERGSSRWNELFPIGAIECAKKQSLTLQSVEEMVRKVFDRAVVQIT